MLIYFACIKLVELVTESAVAKWNMLEWAMAITYLVLITSSATAFLALMRRRMVVSVEGIEYAECGYRLFASWGNVVRIDAKPIWFGMRRREGLIVSHPETKICWLANWFVRIEQQEAFIPIQGVWEHNRELKQAIRQYVPQARVQ